MQGVWIGLGIFIAFMLILAEIKLSGILALLRELRDHFISENHDDK